MAFMGPSAAVELIASRLCEGERLGTPYNMTRTGILDTALGRLQKSPNLFVVRALD